MQENFIVTGGAGFIGSNLARALNRRGHSDIIIVDHLNNEAKKQNLEGIQYTKYFDKTEFHEAMRLGEIAPASAIFHLGACSSTTETDEAYLMANNYGYTRDLCEWALANDIRFIYASSAATYGDGSHGYNDSDLVTPALKPLNLYGRSKQLFDIWALETGNVRKIAGLKYFNVYGPGEDHKGEMRSVINKAYHRLLETGEISLFKSYRPEYRDGYQERDFIYVDDAVAMTLFFYDNPHVSGIYNCGTGIARTWIDLAKAIFNAIDKPPKITFIDMPENIRDKYQYHTQAVMGKIRAAGYKEPIMSIEEGVRRYVRDYLAK